MVWSARLQDFRLKPRVDATNSRVASVPLKQPAGRLIIGVAGGVKKAEAILAALRGKLIAGLITDEAAAQAILKAIKQI